MAWRAWSVLLLLSSTCFSGYAQEALRQSLAGADAAEARRKAASTIGYYNLKLGPTGWRLGAGLGLEFNDNVTLRQNSPEGDLIVRPEVNARMIWPLTDKNSINLALGVGYSAYVKHTELSQIYLTPGTELSFDFYIGDFWINLHDRVSITDNAYQDPTVSGTGDYARLENAIGLSALWDLNKIVVQTGYDHVNYLSLLGNNHQPDGESDLFSLSTAYALRPGVSAGIEAGGGFVHYTGTNVVFNDATQWSLGGFYETQASQYLHLRASAGYTVYAPNNSGSTNTVGDFSGVYAQLSILHHVNRLLDYNLSAGRTINFAFYGGTIDLYFARLSTNWRLFRKTSVGLAFNYEHGSQIDFGSETFDRYGPSLSLSRGITAKLAASINYQFYWRTSDLPDHDYTANIVTLNANYAF